jgi:cysteine-S-conjugate beta-lyase
VFDGLKAAPRAATVDGYVIRWAYLAWMDCRDLKMDAEALNRSMLTKGRGWFDGGQKFRPEGHGFIQVNLGCPRATVDEAIRRLKSASLA